MVRKVMFICAHNQTRSVAGEALVKDERGFEVRSRAAWRGTIRKVRPVDCAWADEIYVMMPGMAVPVLEACPNTDRKKIHPLWIPDTYSTCETALLKLLKKRLRQYDIRPKKSMEQAKEDCWAVTERKMGFTRGGYEFWFPTEIGEEKLEKPAFKAPKEPEQMEFTREGVYIPYWHMEEGARRREGEQQKKLEKELEHWEEETPFEEKMRMFEEAEAYYKQKQKARGRREEAKRSKLEREFLLSEMTGKEQQKFLEREAEEKELARRLKQQFEDEEIDRARKLFKKLKRTTYSVRKLFE